MLDSQPERSATAPPRTHTHTHTKKKLQFSEAEDEAAKPNPRQASKSTMAGERKPPQLPSPFKSMLHRCAPSMKEYGQCVATKVPAVEKGMCEKEFLALKACVQNAAKKK